MYGYIVVFGPTGVAAGGVKGIGCDGAIIIGGMSDTVAPWWPICGMPQPADPHAHGGTPMVIGRQPLATPHGDGTQPSQMRLPQQIGVKALYGRQVMCVTYRLWRCQSDEGWYG